MMPSFDVFLGVDWSGAKGEHHRGIQVAMCETGWMAPVLVNPPNSVYWSRRDVCALIRGFSGERALIGIDFAFAYAFADSQAYFPGFGDSPHRATALWSFIDGISAGAPHLYGGPVFQSDSSPVRSAFWSAGKRPAWFRERPRRTEQRARAVAKPNSPFQTFGPANVGTGSLAGMRALHQLWEHVSIWPFARPGEVTVVEIFPTFLIRRAGVDHRRLFKDRDRIDSVLDHYSSAPYAGPLLDTEDKVDAVVTSAALRALAADPDVWSAPNRDPASRLEGWIFGVT